MDKTGAKVVTEEQDNEINMTPMLDGSVVIQADERSQNKTLVLVMDAARQAGAYNISLATNRD